MTDSFLRGEPRKPGPGYLAPFRGKGGVPYDPARMSTWDKREAFYDHHYREVGEHYHYTLKELEVCEH